MNLAQTTPGGMRDFGTRSRHSFGGKGSNDDSPGKAFGIGKFFQFNSLFRLFISYLKRIKCSNTNITKHVLFYIRTIY